MASGIYLILNRETMKGYIGSASNINRRFSAHISFLRLNKHCNQHLQNSFNKHSEKNFEFYILEYCPKEQLVEREQFYLDLFEPYKTNNGFNKNPKAESCLGVKHSEEANKRKSERQKGHSWNRGVKRSDKYKKRVSEYMRGNKFGSAKRSEEFKRKVSQFHKGRKRSAETRERLSRSIKEWWEKKKICLN